jgi:hypothetical protein
MYFVTFDALQHSGSATGATFPKAARKRYSIRARMRHRNMI